MDDMQRHMLVQKKLAEKQPNNNRLNTANELRRNSKNRY